MTILKLPAIVLIVVHCATGIHGEQQAESCFLYQTNRATSSPEYHLKADQDNYVTINHLFSRPQTTTIVNEDGVCVLKLMNSTSSSTNDGCVTLPYRGEYTTLVFRKLGDKVFVNAKSENEIQLNVSLSSLRVKSSEPINVAFDCPGNCFQFRDALIHAKPKGPETRICLKIYGLIEDQQIAMTDDSKLKLYRGKDWSDHYFWYMNEWKKPPMLNSNEWILFDIDAIFALDNNYPSLNYYFNVSVKTPKSEPIFFPNKLYVVTKDLYIDFNLTRGMRWAIHCQPNEPTQSNTSGDTTPTQGNFADGIKMEYFFTLVAVCGILVITTIILCCIIRNKGKLRRQHTPQTNALSETNAAEPGIVGREGNGQGAVYDYIDIQDLHNYLAKAASENNLADCHIDAKVMQTATSHTSINSIYGCNNDVANCNTNSESLKRFSHTSENSLYGCH